MLPDPDIQHDAEQLRSAFFSAQSLLNKFSETVTSRLPNYLPPGPDDQRIQFIKLMAENLIDIQGDFNKLKIRLDYMLGTFLK